MLRIIMLSASSSNTSQNSPQQVLLHVLATTLTVNAMALNTNLCEQTRSVIG